MEIEIRKEQPSDYAQVEFVTREAFWNKYCPGCCEHYLVHVLREAEVFVPELDLVAVLDGRLIGNVMSIKGVIQGDDGAAYEVLSMGPISVLPEYQRMGVGGRLIEAAKKKARELGYRAVLLCGDPDYYTRQGFTAAENYQIRTADNMYAAALHACELYPGALDGISGCYFEASVYEIGEAEAEVYDKNFPEKEKISGTPSQQKFERIVAMRRKPDEER